MEKNTIVIMQAQIEALQKQLEAEKLKNQALEKENQTLQKESKTYKKESETYKEHTKHLQEILTETKPVLLPTKTKEFIKKYKFESIEVEIKKELEHLFAMDIHGPFYIFNWKQSVINAANRINIYKPDFFEKYQYKVGLENAILEVYIKGHEEVNYGNLPYYFDEDAYETLVAYLEKLPEGKGLF